MRNVGEQGENKMTEKGSPRWCSPHLIVSTLHLCLLIQIWKSSASSVSVIEIVIVFTLARRLSMILHTVNKLHL